MLDRLGRAAPYVVLLGAAAYLYALAGKFEFSAPAGRLGPDAWPKIVLGLLAAVCLYGIGRSLIARGGAGAAGLLQSFLEKAANDAEGGSTMPKSLRRLLAGIGITMLYVALIDVLGFLVATACYLAAFMRVGRYRRYPVIAAASLAGSAALLFIFMRIVYVSLPPGAGPFAALSYAVLALMGAR